LETQLAVSKKIIRLVLVSDSFNYKWSSNIHQSNYN